MEDNRIALSMQLENLDELEKLLSRAVKQEKELRKTLNEIEALEPDIGFKVHVDAADIQTAKKAEFLKRQGMIKCTNCLQYTSKGNYCEQCGCKQINRHKGEA